LAGLEAHIIQERGLGQVAFPNIAGVMRIQLLGYGFLGV